MKSVVVVIIPLFVLLSCSNDRSAVASTPASQGATNADIIRNPVAASMATPADTALMARLNFDEAEFWFGEVAAGRKVKREFAFTNTGKVPLLITDARSTCGCTVPAYPRQPIAPGERGRISVEFDTSNKYGHQRKPVTLTANTYPAQTTVYLEGTVTK